MPRCLPRRPLLMGPLLMGPLALSACALGERRRPVAALPQGRLLGTDENGVRAFRGIPYAAAPAGARRFLPPGPPPHWSGLRDAAAFGPAAMQAVPPGSAMVVSEDCLTLNIWSPQEARRAPVFVWIHGGANISGSSAGRAFDGASFARLGIVCVTLNYRLGAFGFLQLPQSAGAAYAGSGNNAIRDQIAALRWVHDNIGAFGGDPHRVTLGGESAGAKDALAVATAPAARGLIHAVVCESGGGQTVCTSAEAEATAHLFLDAAGLSEAEAGALPGLPAMRLLAAQAALYRDSRRNFPFRPVVDGVTLTRRPLDAVAQGGLRNIRMLIGTNADESRLFLPTSRTPPPVSPHQLAHLDPRRLPEIQARYDRALGKLDTAARRSRLLTAEEYWIPSIRLAEAQVRAGGAVWMYRFDAPAASGRYTGYAVHASELAYVWNNPNSRVSRLTNGPELTAPALAAAMHAAWARFIHDGAPGEIGMPWPRYDLDRRRTALLNARCAVVDDPRGSERQLWTDLL